MDNLVGDRSSKSSLKLQSCATFIIFFLAVVGWWVWWWGGREGGSHVGILALQLRTAELSSVPNSAALGAEPVRIQNGANN